MRGTQEPEWVRRDDPNAVLVAEDDAIIICDGSNSGEVFSGFSGALSSTMAKIERKVPIDQIYLRRFLESNAELFKGTKTGAAIPHLDQDAMLNLEIPLPPLPEQQRIVRLLDKAFEGVTIAKANAEENLQNAHALLKSHLRSVFANNQTGWIEATIDTSCNVEYGTRVVQKRDGGKGYSVYGGGGATFEVDRFNREDRLVIARFGMSAECTRLVAGKFFLNDSGLTVSPKNSENVQRFIDYQLLALNDAIYALGSGTAQKNLDVPRFRALTIRFPATRVEQNEIAAKIASLAQSTDRLSAINVRKLAAVDDLWKAFLHRAYVGQKQAA
jgi:restriction endonuclease S subunit